MRRNALGAHIRAVKPMQIETEDLLDDDRFGRVYCQALFLVALVANCLRLNRSIAERRPRTIEEASPSVLLHRAQRVLAILLALILVEQAENLARHLS